jgi:hypothetical protein
LIGAGTYEGADFFNGLIDNVKIWNEALSGKGGILDDLDEPAGDCTILPADCPAMGEPDDGDSHCQNLEIVGRPDDDTEGIWEFEVTAADDTDDDLYYTLGVFQSTEDGDEDFSVTQFGEGFFEIRLSPGEYLVTARVDDSLFCDDEATDAACTAEFRFTADPLPDELVASFCLEDVGKGSDFTQEAISGLGADLIVHPEEKEPLGDGLPPLGVAGLDEGSATALAFDGLEDVMVLEPHVAFHVDRSYTIAMTIKPGEDPLKAGVTDPNAGAFFTIGPDLEEPADAPGVQILHVFDGLIFLSVLFVDEFTVDEVRVDDGEAHRVLMSIEADFEGELDAIAIYVDGELALEAEADVQEAGNWAEDGGDIVTRVGYGGFDYPSNDFESEVSNDRDINHFNGIIDNVKFWSYALGEDEAFADAEFPSAACGAAFKRGDANNDGVSNISDASFLFNFLFLGGPEPVCADAVDSNDDGDANISDASYLLNYLFLGGPPPPAPGALSCGTDPTLDELQCEDPMGVCL